MFELFCMGLREYWTDNEAGDPDASFEELLSVLSEYYGKKIRWNDPAPDPAHKDDEIDVFELLDEQLVTLHAIAGTLELDGNLDNFNLTNVDEPWNCEVYHRLEQCGEDHVFEKYPHLLALGTENECFCLPVDLPSVASISTGDEDEHECDCDGDCEDGCCCCCDEDCVDVVSLVALRRELDDIADAMKIDKSDDAIDLQDEESSFSTDDELRHGKAAWYILSNRVNAALKAGLPLIIRPNFDELDGDMDSDELDALIDAEMRKD